MSINLYNNKNNYKIINNELTTKKFENNDDSLLFKSYTLIFLNFFFNLKSNNKKIELKNSYYNLYNTLNFYKNKKFLNKYKLVDFYKNTQKINNLSSLNLSKKKISFGKLTWYWLFKTISVNRFLLNYSEYKNNIISEKYFEYEKYLKNYEMIYNKWLKLSINIQKKVKKQFINNNSNNIFKVYFNQSYFSSWDKKFIDKKFIFKNEKFFRKMVFTYKFKIRKRKRKTKLYSSPSIRSFRRKSKHIDNLYNNRLLNSRKNSFYDYALNFSKISKINYKLKKSLKLLKSSKFKLYSSITSSYCRINLLDDVLKNRKPSLLRNYTFSKNLQNNKNFLNFKYIFPKNTIEMDTKNYFNYNLHLSDNLSNINYNKKVLLIDNKNIYATDTQNVFYLNNKYNFKSKYKLMFKKSKLFNNKNNILKNNNYKIKRYLNKKLNNNKINLIKISKSGSYYNKKFQLKKNSINNNFKFINKFKFFFLNLTINRGSKILFKKSINNYLLKKINLNFNLNIKKFNQLITNLLLKNLVQSNLLKQYNIKKFFNTFNTINSLKKLIIKKSKYESKLNFKISKIIEKKKRYQILSNRFEKNLSKKNSNITYNSNKSKSKNKYTEILKNLDKTNALVWKPNLKKWQKYIYSWHSKGGYTIVEKLNKKSAIKHCLISYKNRKNFKNSYASSNLLSIKSILNSKINTKNNNFLKYYENNYKNIFNKLKFIKFIKKYLKIVPAFKILRKENFFLSKKKIN